MNEIMQVIMAGIGTVGFALYFSIKTKHILPAAFVGMISWIVYLAVFHRGANVFAANLISALVVCLLAEIFARIGKAPASIFLIPGIIPLLPGGSLYYTMYAIISSDRQEFYLKGGETVAAVLGIVGGVMIGSIVTFYYLEYSGKWKMKENKGQNI